MIRGAQVVRTHIHSGKYRSNGELESYGSLLKVPAFFDLNF